MRLVDDEGGIVDQNVDAADFVRKRRHGLLGARQVVEVASEIAHTLSQFAEGLVCIRVPGRSDAMTVAPSSQIGA